MKKLILILSTLSIFAVSCKKELVKVNEEATPSFDGKLVSVEKMTDIKVPEGFKWETSKDIKLRLTTTDIRFEKVLHKVEVYTANPAEGGVLIAEGSLGITTAFEATVNIPTFVKTLYLVKIAPDKSKYEEKVNINGTTVLSNISVQTETKKLLGKSSGPDCTTGCTQTVTTSNQNLNINSGDVVCVTGNNISISFNSNGGTIRICGSNVTVQNGNLNNGSNLIVTSTGSASFGNVNLNGSSSTFTNYGTATISNTFASGGNVTNHGTMTIGDDLNFNSGSAFTNNGSVSVGKSFNINGNVTATNNNYIVTNDDTKVNGNGLLTNNCRLWVKKDLHNNSAIKNYSLIRVDDETVLNGSSELGMYNGAMLQTDDITINGLLKGYLNTSLVKVADKTIINGGGAVTHALQFCDANGIETNWGVINNGALAACGLYIPVTSCNTIGSGVPPITDTDNDGVADNNDDYPNDASMAYNNNYGTSTVAFEDLWPAKGDYDLNDVVIGYNYNVITNAANNVVKVEAVYTLRATGGAFKNGFGVQFPVNRNQVSSVSGATLESDQTKAVLIVFNDMRTEMSQWNTRVGQTSSVVTYNVSFNVSGSVSLASFGLGSYNPFIWNGSAGFGRGYEVHLPGKLPTDKATASIFGTFSDNTNVNTGTTYVSKDGGYPWAINIPASFDYPIEKADINSAYIKFATWVSSGGTQYNDWYLNNAGYRNSENIYE